MMASPFDVARGMQQQMAQRMRRRLRAEQRRRVVASHSPGELGRLGLTPTDLGARKRAHRSKVKASRKAARASR